MAVEIFAVVNFEGIRDLLAKFDRLLSISASSASMSHIRATEFYSDVNGVGRISKLLTLLEDQFDVQPRPLVPWWAIQDPWQHRIQIDGSAPHPQPLSALRLIPDASTSPQSTSAPSVSSPIYDRSAAPSAASLHNLLNDEAAACVFVCRSNSARSIAAECVARARAAELCPALASRLRFYSAGPRAAPTGAIKAGVRAALERAGYSVAGLRPKSVGRLLETELRGRPVHCFVTMACDAEADLRRDQAVLSLDVGAPLHVDAAIPAPTRPDVTAEEAAALYDGLVRDVEAMVSGLPVLLQGARPLLAAPPQPQPSPLSAPLPPREVPPSLQTSSAGLAGAGLAGAGRRGDCAAAAITVAALSALP